MGQRINIQYSIDMDDLGSEAVRMIENSKEKLQKVCKKLESFSDTVKNKNAALSSTTVNEIALIRQALADVDFSLGDVTSIVAGYVSYEMEELTRSAQEPTQLSEQDSNATTAVERNPEFYKEHESIPAMDTMSAIPAFEEAIENLTALNEKSPSDMSLDQVRDEVERIKRNFTEAAG